MTADEPSHPSGGGLRIVAMALSADGALAAVATADHRVSVWDLESRTRRSSKGSTEGPVHALAWNPRAEVFAAVRGIVELTRPRDGATVLLRTVLGARGQVGVAHSPRGLFSGDREAFERLRFRDGDDLLKAPMLKAADVSDRRHRPTLLAELLAGCSLGEE